MSCLRTITRLFFLVCAILQCAELGAVIEYSNSYRSPRNAERATRKKTELIILHTTEAPEKSSLNKLCERGEANFCVTENGTVYRIVDRDLEAYHAGRSMWSKRSNVDEISVGIEVVGYHDRQMPLKQLNALRDLIIELKAHYNIPDHKVLAHSHVAYGAPNRWQKKSHRGRKRCGMLFAMPSVRRILKLSTRPKYDPDVRAKRLIQADKYLSKVLYGSIDTMKNVYEPKKKKDEKKQNQPASRKSSDKSEKNKPKDKIQQKPQPGSKTKEQNANQKPAAAKKPETPKKPAPAKTDKTGNAENTISKLVTAYDIAKDDFDSPKTIYTLPDGRCYQGNKIKDFKKLPYGTKVLVLKKRNQDPPEKFRTLGIDGKSLTELARDEAFTSRTIIVTPDGKFTKGSSLDKQSAAKLPYGTKVLVGYASGGPVSAYNTPLKICGSVWRSPNTYYLISKTLIPGDKVNDKRIPSGTMIFYRK